MKYSVRIGEEDIELEIRHSGDATDVVIGDRVLTADVVRIAGSPIYSLVLDGRSHEVSVHRRKGRFALVIGGESYDADVMDERAMRIAEATGDGGEKQSGGRRAVRRGRGHRDARPGRGDARGHEDGE